MSRMRGNEILTVAGLCSFHRKDALLTGTWGSREKLGRVDVLMAGITGRKCERVTAHEAEFN